MTRKLAAIVVSVISAAALAAVESETEPQAPSTAVGRHGFFRNRGLRNRSTAGGGQNMTGAIPAASPTEGGGPLGAGSARANAGNRYGGGSAASGGRSGDSGQPNGKTVESGDRSIEFVGAPVEMVLKVYGELIGKTVLKDPNAPAAQITLQPMQKQELSDDDKILAIETVLEMNGIHLEPFGEKFVRAIPRAGARKEGIPLIMDPDAKLEESAKVVSLMLTFRNIALDEAQKALEGLKSDKGVLNVFERSGSILVTDTEMNISRMREVIRAIDIPTPVTENVFVIQIQHASATEIQKVLQAIVEDAKKILEKQGKQAQSGSRPVSPPIPGAGSPFNRRAQAAAAPAATANESQVTSVSDADRGMLRGDSLIIADERSNKLVIKTQAANMNFFEKIIGDLDIETTPDTVVKVYRLKYAEAEDVADMINDLIGNAASSKSSSKGSQNANSKQAGNQKSNVTTGTTQKKPSNQRTGEAKTGELSKENTTVLADKRINGIVVMTNKELVPVIEQIIESMDIKLSQVLIETCIIEVSLDDNLKTGIDWVNGMQKQNGAYQQALGGGGGSGKPAAPGAGGGNLVDNASTAAAYALPTIFAPGSAGISYALFSEKLNLSAVITASKTDSHSKYIASPIIMTVDNKEATIDATENLQFISGWSAQSGGTWSGSGMPTPNYTAKDIGIKLKMTPKINPNGTVMLTVEEEYSQVHKDGQQMLVPTGTSYDTSTSDSAVERKMTADILLDNMQSVVLGGLTDTKIDESTGGIPILKDIPYIGKWLFGKVSQQETRKELLVFLTPYVLDDAQAAQIEAARRKNTMSDPRPWEDRGWSKSAIADPVSAKEKIRREKESWKKQDEERESEKALDKMRLERAMRLIEIEREKSKEGKEPSPSPAAAEEGEQPANLLGAMSQESAEKPAEKTSAETEPKEEPKEGETTK